MIVGGINAATVANAVWSNATRNLTGFNGAIQGPFNSVHVSLAAATNVDLRPGVNQVNDITVAVESNSGSPVAAMYDGVTFRPNRALASTGDSFSGTGTSPFGPALQNVSGTTAFFYDVSGWKWTS